MAAHQAPPSLYPLGKNTGVGCHFLLLDSDSVQFSSVSQSCPTLCDPMNHGTPGLPVHHQLLEFTQIMSIESVMPSSHLILCRPLLLLPSIPPSIRVFSNESTLRMRWPKYWSFSFSIIPSKEMPSAAIWMQLEIIILSKSERERQIPYDITYMWNLKYDMNELIYEVETDSQT